MAARIILNETSYHGAGAVKSITAELAARGLKGGAKGQSLLIQVRQAKLGRTNSGRSYIVKKSTYD